MTIESVEIDKPKRNEVLVRTRVSGLCHSDLHFMEGKYPTPVPAVLGHEAAGVVEAVGEDVTHVKPGDHVVTCLSVFCGHCVLRDGLPDHLQQYRGQDAARQSQTPALEG